MDANNVTTTLSYDARGRMLSKSVGGLVTSYTYEPTGLLSTVTPPNGNTVRYSYDAARRLSQITDGKGNQISYVRDAKGNVLQEERRDPSGLLSGYAQ